MSNKTLTAEQQKHLDDLVKRCVDFAQLGKVSPWLNPIPELFSNGVDYNGAGALVEHKYENLTINVSYFLTFDHDGLWLIMVQEENRVVLKASSKGMVVKNVSAKIYIPGDWEKKITARPRVPVPVPKLSDSPPAVVPVLDQPSPKAPLPPLSDWTEAFPDPPTTKPKRR